MAKMRFSRRLWGAAAVAGLCAVAACTKPASGPTYDEYVARWVGDAEVNLVSAWGIPAKSHALQQGGRIVEYTRAQNEDVVCTTRFTIDESGRIVKYWYLGSRCRPPKEP